ncbi:hypothetical protein [Gluconobacter oxydans]|uniref:hypothetical protein n=1 Tax=Gluconobacter oxydans TaxID=442 RepID=UPI003464C994
MNGLKVNVVLHIALLVLTGLVFWLTGTGLKLTNELFIIYGLVFSFACFIALMPRYRRDTWLTLSIQGVFFFSVGAGCAGVTSLAALRAQAPLQDALLARLDHDLGFSVPAFLYFCSGHQNLNRVLYVLEPFWKFAMIGFQEVLSVIQRQDVDASTTRPHGRNYTQDETLSV